jgi:hypothetical protein
MLTSFSSFHHLSCKVSVFSAKQGQKVFAIRLQSICICAMMKKKANPDSSPEESGLPEYFNKTG